METVRVAGGFDLKTYRRAALRLRRPLASTGLVGAGASGLIWDGFPRHSIWPCTVIRFRCAMR
jgi:hypothetical protein